MLLAPLPQADNHHALMRTFHKHIRRHIGLDSVTQLPKIKMLSIQTLTATIEASFLAF